MAARSMKLGQGELWGQVRRRPALARTLGWTGSLVLGAAMGAGPLFGAPGPFGIALAAAGGWGLEGFLCLLGVCAGYLLAGGLAASIRYVAAAFLTFTVGFVTSMYSGA